jgi:putative tryptophan/tyrosine transport system substrate-binding protein
MMSRRRFVVAAAALAAHAVSAAHGAGAQQATAPRIGVLGPAEQPRFGDLVGGLRQGLRALGHEAPGPVLIEAPVARGDRAAAAAATQRLRGVGVTVLFAIGTEVALAAEAVAPELSIVFITPGDPVASGVVASFARPGRNMTGVTFEFPELSGKRVELIRDVLGTGRRVVAVHDPRDASPRQGMEEARRAARQLGITLVEYAITGADDAARAQTLLAGADALLAIPGGATTAYWPTLLAAAHTARAMTVFPSHTEVTHEALLTYGARDIDIARDAARLIDRIIKGAKPGDLPVERPTRFQMGVNLKTARTLGITVPEIVMIRATEVIE